MESEFLNDRETRCVASIGAKGSGKTTSVLNYIQYCYDTNKYSHYYLCIPELSIRNSKGDKYEFIRRNKQTTIFTKYSPKVIEYVLKKANGKDKILFVIEDATQYKLRTDTNLLRCMTTARQLKIQIWLVLHSARNVLSVPVRSNLDYLFIYKITNRMLLQSLWEEYFSIYSFDKFMEFINYFQHLQQTKFNGIFLNTISLKYEEIVKLPVLSAEPKLYIEEKRQPKKEDKKEDKRVKENIFSKLKVYY